MPKIQNLANILDIWWSECFETCFIVFLVLENPYLYTQHTYIIKNISFWYNFRFFPRPRNRKMGVVNFGRVPQGLEFQGIFWCSYGPYRAHTWREQLYKNLFPDGLVYGLLCPNYMYLSGIPICNNAYWLTMALKSWSNQTILDTKSCTMPSCD